jgi:hypothetical protein
VILFLFFIIFDTEKKSHFMPFILKSPRRKKIGKSTPKNVCIVALEIQDFQFFFFRRR